MSDPNAGIAVGFLSAFGYFVGILHFESAVGAVLGSFFFLSLPSTTLSFKSVFLWIASLGFGYLAGFLASKYAWDNVAAIIAFLMSAMGSTILMALQKYLDGGPLPDFIVQILDRVPFLSNKRGKTDV